MPLSTFTPDTDLRSTQITPGASPRLAGIQGQTDQAAQGVSGFRPGQAVKGFAGDFGSFLKPRTSGFRPVNTTVQRGHSIQPAYGPDLQAFRAQRMGAAAAIGSGPSRSAIAQQRLSAFDTAAAPQIRDLQEQTTQRAAATGSLGAGRTSIETLRPFTDYLTQRSAMETGLAADTAEGEIADRQRALESAQNLVAQESGQEAANRGEQRGERDYTTGIDTANLERGMAERNAEVGANQFDINQEQGANQGALSAALGLSGQEAGYGVSRLGALGGLEGSIYGQEAADRGELRGERGREDALEGQAYDRGIQGLTLEDALTNSAFGRSLSQYQAGRQGNPSNAMLALSQLTGNNASAASGALSQLLQLWGMRQSMGGSGGAQGGGYPQQGGGYGSPTGGAPYDPRTQGYPTVPTDDGGYSGYPTDPFGPLGLPGGYEDPYGDAIPYGDVPTYYPWY